MMTKKLRELFQNWNLFYPHENLSIIVHVRTSAAMQLSYLFKGLLCYMLHAPAPTTYGDYRDE